MTSSFLARAGALGCTVLLLASCQGGSAAPDGESDTGPAPTRSPEQLPETPEELQAFYQQQPSWQECGRFECADIEVPLSYQDPGGESIEIAVKRLAGTEPIGSLFINPGGPGGSGTQLVDSVGMMFSSDVLDGYDVVGFDPRGVTDSSAVECVSDDELDEIRAASYDPEDPTELDEFIASADELAAACEAGTGELLGQVDTVSAARDLDVLRHVLGEAQLDYLGYSYGTLLGATYAELFPENVGQMVLDGGLDPSSSSSDLVLGQAAGFESALADFVADCLAGSQCPLTGSVDDGVGQVRDLIELAEHTPLPTGSDRELTSGLLVSGILLPLYEDAMWPMLSSALDAAMHDKDGSQLLVLADLGADREPDGGYATNSTEANIAINCLDYPATGDLEQMRKEATELEELSPTFGGALSYGDVTCAAWPHEATGEREPISATGAGPILVVGTTGDPATPYAWSEALAEQLDDATLLTYDGAGHTAYGRSNGCISEAVDGYLLSGAVPEDGLVC